MANVNDLYILRLVSYTTGKSQIGVNVLHYYALTKVGTGATDTQIADALDALMAPVFKGWMTAGARWRGTQAQKIKPVLQLPVSVVTRDGVGTAAGDALPTQVSGVISFRTAFAGRKQRGRMYPPFPSTTENTTNGAMSATGITNIDAIATALPKTYVAGAGGNTNTMSLCIFHRALGTFDDVLTVVADHVFGTQRRRGDFGRTNPLPF